MDICITEFQSKDILDFIPALSIWVASWMNIWVRPHNLVSARHVQLSVRMSGAVSMSMNQSSGFEESCPSNAGMCFSMVMVRFESLCCMQCVCVCCMVLCTGSSLGWGVECGWCVTVRCWSLSVSCVTSAVDRDQWVIDFKLQNWSLSCQNCIIVQPRGTGYRRQKSHTRWWLWWACWVGHLLCRWGASQRGVGEIQSVTGEHLICLPAGIFNCSTVRFLIIAPVKGWKIAGRGKGVEWLLHQCEGTECLV